jgi:hypothetical protein
MLKLVISALTVGICRSVCRIVFSTYCGAFTIDHSYSHILISFSVLKYRSPLLVKSHTFSESKKQQCSQSFCAVKYLSTYVLIMKIMSTVLFRLVNPV